MSVLARELESYQRALSQYRRAASKYNARVDDHNAAARTYTDSLVRDENGQPYVILAGSIPTRMPTDEPGHVGEGAVRGVYVAAENGQLAKAQLPAGLNPRDYELSPVGDGSSGLMMLRRPTDQKRVETIPGLVGPGNAITDESSPSDSGWVLPREIQPSGDTLQQGVAPTQFVDSGFGNPWQFIPEQAYDPSTFTAQREVSVQPESPGEWGDEFTQRRPEAPDPTLSAVRRMGRPSLARMEGGLIGEAIRGRGVR